MVTDESRAPIFQLNSNNEVVLIPGDYEIIPPPHCTSPSVLLFTHQCGDAIGTHVIRTYGYERDLSNNRWERYTAYAARCERTGKIFIVEGYPERYEGILMSSRR